MTYNGTNPDAAVPLLATVDQGRRGVNVSESARFYTIKQGWRIGTEITVTVWRSDDGALVVQADIPEDQRVRVNVNDGVVFDQHTGTGEDFGSTEDAEVTAP